MVKYTYHGGQSFGVAAQLAGSELLKIEQRDGQITPSAVVDEARDPAAPLHPAFEWDDEAAAELWRQEQARRLIRSVRVIRIDPEDGRKKDVAFLSIERESAPRGYLSAAKVLSDPEMRGQAIADALAQLRGMQRRYEALKELKDVLAAAALRVEAMAAAG